MDNKKGKAKPVKKYKFPDVLVGSVKSMTEVIDGEYGSCLESKKQVKAKHTQFEKYIEETYGKLLDVSVPMKASTISSGDYYTIANMTDGKAIIKKPVKKKPPTTMLKIKKAPQPYNRIIREKDFKFPRVYRQNTLRAEKRPQVSIEEDEFRDVKALEIKVG